MAPGPSDGMAGAVARVVGGACQYLYFCASYGSGAPGRKIGLPALECWNQCCWCWPWWRWRLMSPLLLMMRLALQRHFWLIALIGHVKYRWSPRRRMLRRSFTPRGQVASSRSIHMLSMTYSQYRHGLRTRNSSLFELPTHDRHV